MAAKKTSKPEPPKKSPPKQPPGKAEDEEPTGKEQYGGVVDFTTGERSKKPTKKK